MTIEDALRTLKPFCIYLPDSWDTVLRHIDELTAKVNDLEDKLYHEQCRGL